MTETVPKRLQPKKPKGWVAFHDERWTRISAALLDAEGGLADHANDRGGLTKYGVSLRFLKAAGKIDADRDGFADLDLNFDTVLDGQDIRALTPAIASALFLDHFFIRPHIWMLPPPFDAAVCDQAVNGGTTSAIRMLQVMLNRLYRTSFGMEPIKEDAVLGPRTLRRLEVAILDRGDGAVLASYRGEVAARYLEIARLDPEQKVFLNGWLNRARRLGDV